MIALNARNRTLHLLDTAVRLLLGRFAYWVSRRPTLCTYTVIQCKAGTEELRDHCRYAAAVWMSILTVTVGNRPASESESE